MIAVGQGFEVGGRKGLEPHPVEINVVDEERFGRKGLLRLDRFINAPEDLGAFFVPLVEIEEKEFPFGEIARS